MSKFDATRYSILVRKEETEDGELFVARVAELPDVTVYAEAAGEAYDHALDVIETAKEMFDEDGMDFPSPEENRDRAYSGRLPLRVPKSLHRALVKNADREGMSLNAYALYLLSGSVAYDNVLKMIREVTITQVIANIVEFDDDYGIELEGVINFNPPGLESSWVGSGVPALTSGLVGGRYAQD